MRHDHLFFLNDFRGQLAECLVFLLESSLSLWGASVHAEKDVLILAGLSERVKMTITLLLSVFFEDVALVESPRHSWNFVVEEARSVSASPVLETKPLKGIWLLTLTTELLWSPFSL